MASLFERYRPQTWSEVVGQDKLVAKVNALRPRGLGGRAWWIAGPSGAGKTTCARILAREVAADHAITEMDASELTPADVRAFQTQWRGRPLGSPGWALLLNEAHGLRRDTVRALLVMLEDLPDYAVVIFTTTAEGQESLFDDQIDAHPLLSRCIELPLARRGLAEAFAKRAHEIAEAEGLNGRPLADYARLLKDCRNSMRAALQKIEAGWALQGNDQAE
ncbi:MAG TPA: AAA family ATPase [Planctomycetaceae bacterium]|nr:AAA family ATPase [Planctomycetaceae bacterium]